MTTPDPAPVDASSLAVAASGLRERATATTDTEGLLRDLSAMITTAEAYLSDIEDSISAG